MFYLEGLPSNRVQELTNQFNILFIRLGDIVEQLQNESFAEIIRVRRNIIAHGEMSNGAHLPTEDTAISYYRGQRPNYRRERGRI